MVHLYQGSTVYILGLLYDVAIISYKHVYWTVHFVYIWNEPVYNLNEIDIVVTDDNDMYINNDNFVHG